MQTEIVEVLTCNCKPNFVWKTPTTYKAHFKSQRHKAYDNVC